MKKIFGWLSQVPAPNEQDEEQDEEGSFINCEQQLPPMSGILTERKEEPTPPSSPLLYNSQEGVRKMRVTLFVNGARSGGKVMLVRPTDTLLEFLLNAGKKLGTTDAKRVFTKDGGEVDDVEEINPDDVLYISHGEDFIPLLSQGPPPPATTSHTTATTASTTTLPFAASATPINAEQKENKKRGYDDDEAEMEEEEQEVPQATATTTTTIQSSGDTVPPTRSFSSLSSSSSSSSSLGSRSSAAFAQATRKVTVTGSVGKLSPAEEERYHQCLKTYFGYSSFRPLQLEVIRACLEGKDSFLCMATGAGKSLCYQLPALLTQKARTGVVVVVSPLISLMVDQVLSLQQANVKACLLGSAQKDSAVERDACNGKYNLVYMSPEKIVNMKRQLQELEERKLLVLLAIDEAHCVSEWGHDFRREYREMGKVREWIPSVPVMAVTGTATGSVESDIIASLVLRHPVIAKSSFARPNLFFSVAMKSADTSADLKKLLFPSASSSSTTSSSSWITTRRSPLQLQESVIIYCFTIKETEIIASLVQAMGVRAEVYHANLGPSVRDEVHKKFVTDQVEVIVATVAFGMGIDKPDVRKIIHFGPPKSLEAYYQQAGRAGRDGLAASCHLLYAPADLTGYRFLSGSQADRLKMGSAVAAYASTTACRQQHLLQYFGEQAPPCGNCDNCLQPPDSRDFAEEALLLLNTISLTGGKFGMAIVIDVLRGSRAAKILQYKFDRLPTHGQGKHYSKEWWGALMRQLMCQGYIAENIRDLYKTYAVSAKGLKWANAGYKAGERMVLPIPVEMRQEENNRAQVKERQKLITDQQQLRFMDKNVEELFGSLISLNREEARSRGLAPYMVIPIAVLESLARLRPTTEARFRAIEGVDDHKARTYAATFTRAIQEFCGKRSMRTDVEGPEAQKPGMVAVDMAATSPQKRGQKRTLDGAEKMTQAKMEVYKLFAEQNLSIDTICQMRGVKPTTVMSYLGAAIENGYAVDWRRLGISPDARRTVEQTLDALPPAKRAVLRAIKERIPDPAIDYGVVRLVQAQYLLDAAASAMVADMTTTDTTATLAAAPSPLPELSTQALPSTPPPRRLPPTTLVRTSSFPSPTTSTSSSSSSSSSFLRSLSFNAGGSSAPSAAGGNLPRQQTFASTSTSTSTSAMAARLPPYPPSFTATPTTARPVAAAPPPPRSKFVRHAGNKLCPSPSVSPAKQQPQPSQREEVEEEEEEEELQSVRIRKRRRLHHEPPPLPSTQDPAAMLTQDPASTQQQPQLSEDDVLRFIKENGGSTTFGLLRAFPKSRAAEVDAVLAALQENYFIYRGDDNRYLPL